MEGSLVKSQRAVQWQTPVNGQFTGEHSQWSVHCQALSLGSSMANCVRDPEIDILNNAICDYSRLACYDCQDMY